ncbi:hypothetical protein [Frigoriglobus tundricola]|uniref:Uncharacterized protein n=1 Tax=Frigoriglobus tundricola TaxID=2774151 RepID=A0A6M5YUZ1_9BACT|nr:hypothetical protein [Frigoriglobus tundricola]QJW97264.1 hypothetical protein FTUN_4834 [Frigoriglobus tundricola]
MSLRHRVAKLELTVAPPQLLLPMVVECRRVGDFGESRPPGVYNDGAPGSACRVVVYEGDQPDENVLAQFRPARGPGPLIITFGPEVVPPPDSFPEPFEQLPQ